MLHPAFAFLVTLAIAGGIYGLGDWLVPRAGAGARWVFGWTTLWWVIALPAQLVRPKVGAAFGLAMTVVGLARMLRRGGESKRALVIGGSALILGAPLWLAPPHFYDALVYHLGLPWSWLANRSFAPVDHNLFSHFPLAASTVFLLPVAAKAPEAAAGLHWLTFIAVLGSLAALSRNLGAGRWSWAAPALLCGTWHAPWLASLAAADHLVILGIVAAAESWTSPREADPPWAETGVPLGLALSAKYTALVPVAALLLAALALRRPRWHAIAAGATGFAVSSFWWIRNLIDVGNPIHPLLWSVFGGRGWSADEYARYSTLVREGVSGTRGVLTGVLKLGLPSGLGLWLGIATLAALAAVLRAREESSRSAFVALAAVLAVAGWAATSQTSRYALPAAALIAALAAAGIAQLSPWLARATAGLLGIAVAHGVLTLGVFLFDTIGIQRAWMGTESREAWRHDVTLNDPAGAYRAAGEVLPKDARILIVGEGRSWLCPRPHRVSSPYDTQWLQSVVEHSSSAEEVGDAVAGDGWTHLLINWAEVNRLGGEDYRVLRWKSPEDQARFREFGKSFTEPVWTDGPLEIRALRR